MAMNQLGIGCGYSAMDLGVARLHDLRLEDRELRQDLRLAWRRHQPAALVLSDRLRHPRRGGTERGNRASNHSGEARSDKRCSLDLRLGCGNPQARGDAARRGRR
jgi:hypothetical protein